MATPELLRQDPIAIGCAIAIVVGVTIFAQSQRMHRIDRGVRGPSLGRKSPPLLFWVCFTIGAGAVLIAVALGEDWLVMR